MIVYDKGRTALKAALIGYERKITRILIPNFICDAVPQTLDSLNIEIAYYNINDDFSIDYVFLDKILQNDANFDAFLMVNYFGQINDIDKIIEICSTFNLVLIEDNSHGHGGFYRKKMLGHFGDIGFSSPRKILNRSSGGVAFYSGNYINSINFPIHEESFIKRVAYMLLNLFPQLRIFLLLTKNINDPLVYKEVIFQDFTASDRIFLEIDNSNWFEISSNRRLNWKKWEVWLGKYNLLPAIKLNEESCPWAIPFYVDNPKERKRIYKWMIFHGYTPFVWPTLPDEVLKSHSSCIDRWKRLICVRVDKAPNDSENLSFK